VLTIHKLTKTLGGRTLFRDAEFSINWGERIALVGPNGAGKSTPVSYTHLRAHETLS
jgi:ATP-binding cassette subfamily F protein 3